MIEFESYYKTWSKILPNLALYGVCLVRQDKTQPYLGRASLCHLTRSCFSHTGHIHSFNSCFFNRCFRLLFFTSSVPVGMALLSTLSMQKDFNFCWFWCLLDSFCSLALYCGSHVCSKICVPLCLCAVCNSSPFWLYLVHEKKTQTKQALLIYRNT